MRQCNKCGATKPTEEFKVVGRLKDGSVRRGFTCKECSARIARLWYEEAKQHPIDAPTVPEKFCTACRRVRSAAFFHRKTSDLTGLQQYCVDCFRRLADGEKAADIRAEHGQPNQTRLCQSYRELIAEQVNK